ncbi:hypothetical protein C6499_22710 [Candidatus Poribacteria bacterium]|nr:MAG: hypothetical protein C6499_22710 [Candidatus Poribacteria bacterium]
MINQRIEHVVKFIREARDEADSLGERILFFVAFLLIGTAVAAFAYLLCMLAFTAPKVFIPIYFSIFILWQGYKHL